MLLFWELLLHGCGRGERPCALMLVPEGGVLWLKSRLKIDLNFQHPLLYFGVRLSFSLLKTSLRMCSVNLVHRQNCFLTLQRHTYEFRQILETDFRRLETHANKACRPVTWSIKDRPKAACSFTNARIAMAKMALLVSTRTNVYAHDRSIIVSKLARKQHLRVPCRG